MFGGVYDLGSDALSQEGSLMAGALAGGPGAVLSHRTAGALWGITDAGPRVEVTRAFGLEPVTGLAPGCRIPGLRIRRTRSLPASEMVRRSGIPAMSLERTLLSLASVLTKRRLESAFAAARRTGELDPAALDRTLDRGPGCKGIGVLRNLVARSSDLEARTKSVLEERFLALCKRAIIPKPSVKTRVEGVEGDCCWPQHMLIVELDGFKYHSDPLAFARDRSRDASLMLGGYRVLRLTYEQVSEKPGWVVETVTRLLDRVSP